MVSDMLAMFPEEGRTMFIIYSDRVGSSMAVLVVGDHHRKVEGFKVLCGQCDADITAAGRSKKGKKRV